MSWTSKGRSGLPLPNVDGVLRDFFFQFVRRIRSIARSPRDSFFLFRLLWTRQKASPDNTFSTQVLPPGFFINLDYRTDRRQEAERELSRMGLPNVQRFPAILRPLGELGVVESHLALMIQASRDRAEPFMVLEDDVQFLCTRAELQETVAEFLSDGRLDVLLLSPIYYGLRWPVSKRLAVANSLRTCAAYVVKPRSLTPLANSYRATKEDLSNGKDPKKFALDVTWEALQKKALLFAVPRKTLVIQRPSYSDIQHRNVQYPRR